MSYPWFPPLPRQGSIVLLCNSLVAAIDQRATSGRQTLSCHLGVETVSKFALASHMVVVSRTGAQRTFGP
ncbi:hypothetical protein MES4922_370034 [Mesorhizobium ventifaucium]|uniref:Secreted protein n=1 Tax=Mesorhizobium ventifaucium TaxID=666020 RepID=A0ABN8K5Z9_9HYPH|nr:hypothetical protein MES4922_370034 [Mesorhizobium ventifaucium]